MARKSLSKSAPSKTRSKHPEVEVISSKLSYEGPLFRVYTDEILEKGRRVMRDVVRHNGSIVILAIDDSKSKRDPLIVMEVQNRHARIAGRNRFSRRALAQDGALLCQPRLSG